MLEVVAVALWVMLPAYVPNNAAVLFGGGPPIDGGRTMGGSRILGDGKTWRGTAAGVLAGALLAVVLDLLDDAVGVSDGDGEFDGGLNEVLVGGEEHVVEPGQDRARRGRFVADCHTSPSGVLSVH